MGLKSDQFESGLKKAKTGLLGMKSGLTDAVSNLTGLNVGALGAAGAVGLLASGLKFAISEASEAERVSAKLNAVLASTKGAAGLSADQLNAMADSLSALNAVDDEAIVNSEALMLTFTKIGKDVFPNAMQAAIDMSAVMGTDLQSSVMMLGKALNDPVQGMTALRRAGVSYTKDQQEVIKALQESGDLMGAQKLVLQELNTEFGGAGAKMADTYAGKMQKLNIAVGNLAESIGTKVLPGVTAFVEKLGDGIGVLELLVTWQDRVNAAAEEQTTNLLENAKSYDEYAKGIIEVGIATGQLDTSFRAAFDDQDKLKRGQEGLNIYLDEAAQKMGLLTEAEWENTKSMEDSDKHLEALAKQYKAAADGADDLSDANVDLETNLDTVMGSMKEVTKEILFQKAAANMDADAALELGRAIGVIDEASYAALSGLDELKAKYDKNADGAIDAAEAASGYADEVQRIVNLQEHLQSKEVTYRINLEVSEQGGGAGIAAQELNYGIDINGNGVIGKAGGGPVSANSPYIVGERGPELFVPSTSGRIIPNDDLTYSTTSAGGGGLSFSINKLTVYANTPSDLMRQLVALGNKTKLAALGGAQYQGA